MECPICYENIDLLYETPCNHKFCYLCLKTSFMCQNKKCPLCRADLPNDLCNNAILKEDIQRVDVYWTYSGRNNGMWQYDINSNELLEQGYQNFLTNPNLKKIKIKILGKEFTINYSKMIQKGERGSRKILRVNSEQNTQNVKGIAGLRKEN